MLKITKIELELIKDPDMYIFFEKGAKGGISYTSNRYIKANNTYLKSYYSKKESKHTIYLETNNLYGYAVSKVLPTSGFKWIDPKEFNLNNSKKCVLKLILNILNSYTPLHHDYPLAPGKIEIEREMLSEYQLKITDSYNNPIGNVEKLVPNFSDKEKYVIHSENLKLYLRIGLKLKKIYCVLEFNQSQCLTTHIEFSRQKMIEAEKNNDKDGKALYKLMNNAIYGKTMENLFPLPWKKAI